MDISELELRYIVTLKALSTATGDDQVRLSLEADHWRELIQVALRQGHDDADGGQGGRGE